MTPCRLTLYITGHTARSDRAARGLRRICEKHLGGHYELRVVDVLDDPQAAEDNGIVATPTLIKELPPPVRRVIGDLTDEQLVLAALEIRHLEEANDE